MKITNVLFESPHYFKTIKKIVNSDKLSVMDAYRINRLVKNLNELNTEYTQLKKGLLDQFGEPDEEKGGFKIKDECRESFSKEMTDLINIEHELNPPEKLSFPSKIKDGISAIDLDILELFFDLNKLEVLEDISESSAETDVSESSFIYV